MSSSGDPSVPDPQRLAAMRRSYERGGLEEGDLAPTWSAMLGRWLDDAEAGGIASPMRWSSRPPTPTGGRACAPSC